MATKNEEAGIPEGATPIYDTNGTSGMADALEAIHAQVYSMARETGNGPKNFVEDVSAFVAAVDWSERWIQLLLAGHLILWFTTVWTRRRFSWQSLTFFVVCSFVWSSEMLNTYARANWERFSTQNYFDSHGFFISVMFSGPLLLLAMFQMVNFLIIASNLLVEVKREEIKRKILSNSSNKNTRVQNESKKRK